MSNENKIEALKLEIKQLKERLTIKEHELRLCQQSEVKVSNLTYKEAFTPEEIIRYSRQMLVPSINAKGQYLLKNSKVLIVGVGGLGCPAALYLASAGVGELVLVDYDDVELSNLHRQVLHTEAYLGKPKVESARDAILNLNKNVKVTPLKMQINNTNIQEILSENTFNCVIDCSDNVPTRYLLNDACVLSEMPLISGSALQMDGQLTVYNYGEGPCYRCLFPEPPPARTVMSCGDAGVLGVIPGVIGVLQALEAIKIITGAGEILSQKYLVFDGITASFRTVKLRSMNASCEICGIHPTIDSLIDYEQFCGSKANDKVENINIMNNNEQIDVQELSNISKTDIILDVRSELEYKMCHLPFTKNFPYTKLENNHGLDDLRILFENNVMKGGKNVYVLCRRGNDSQRASLIMKNKFKDLNMNYYNIKGGLHAYSKYIDSNFPVY